MEKGRLPADPFYCARCSVSIAAKGARKIQGIKLIIFIFVMPIRFVPTSTATSEPALANARIITGVISGDKTPDRRISAPWKSVIGTMENSTPIPSAELSVIDTMKSMLIFVYSREKSPIPAKKQALMV